MVGQFVFSKAGHDKGTLYVIVAEEGDFVYVAEGRLKTLEHPKRKRRLHIQPVNRTVEETLCRKLAGREKVYDEEIKYAIRQVKEKRSDR